jgi:hypothetical protein
MCFVGNIAINVEKVGSMSFESKMRLLNTYFRFCVHISRDPCTVEKADSVLKARSAIITPFRVNIVEETCLVVPLENSSYLIPHPSRHLVPPQSWACVD